MKFIDKFRDYRRKKKNFNESKFYVEGNYSLNENDTPFTCKLSENFYWDLDKNLAIIIRDSLRILAKNTCSYPTWIELDCDEATQDYDSSMEADVKEPARLRVWKRILNEIANKFDFYLTSEFKFISDEDNQFLESSTESFTYEENGHTFWKCPESHKKIYDKLDAIEEKQHQALKEALADLVEIWGDLWD